MTTSEYRKPLPRGEDPALTDPFWEAVKRHELLIPRCVKCNKFFWYPRQECPHCMQRDWNWEKVSGKGRLHTFTIVRQPQNPSFNDDVPYVYAIVQLDEGVRMVSNVIGCKIPEDVKVDMALEVTFDDVTAEQTLFKFKPVSA